MADPAIRTVVHVVGARPNFMKIAPLMDAMRAEPRFRQALVNTGQHYDESMAGSFFRELSLPVPDRDLGVGSGSHAVQTAKVMMAFEEVCLELRPDLVVVVGDVNSTMAAAIVAAKLTIPIAHVEAGLRSFNRAMPEEQNRVVADHLSSILFCPTDTAVRNLAAEGVTDGVHQVGDVMAEALVAAAHRARQSSRVLDRLGLADDRFLLVTVHRAENTDNAARLRGILDAVNRLGERVVFPMHPRTRRAVEGTGWRPDVSVMVIEPQGYLDMIRLESAAGVVLTDSGGVQKEAYWLGVPCVTLRDETEWVETLADGRSVLAGAETDRIVACARAALDMGTSGALNITTGGDNPLSSSTAVSSTADTPSQRIARLLTEFR